MTANYEIGEHTEIKKCAKRKLKLENMYQTVFININGIRYAFSLYIESSVVLPKLLAQNQIAHFYFG